MSRSVLASSAILIVLSTSPLECTVRIFIEFTYIEFTTWEDVDVRASSTSTILKILNVDVSTTVLDAPAIGFVCLSRPLPNVLGITKVSVTELDLARCSSVESKISNRVSAVSFSNFSHELLHS